MPARAHLTPPKKALDAYQQSLADFRDFDRRLNRGGRFAPRLRRAKIHDEVNHLVEFERF